MVAPHRSQPDSVTRPSEGDALAQARAERDAALAKLETIEHRRVTGGTVRRVVVGVLVFLVALLVPVTGATAWVRHTVLNTDNYVATVAPIANDPAVTSAAARIVTDQVFAAIDPEPIVVGALPPKAAFLAGPITNGVKGFVDNQVKNILGTAAFQQIWVTANRVAHQALLKVLNGQAKALKTTDGQVVLDLVPLLNNVLGAVQQQASDLIGKNVTLPTLTGDELPSAACAKISAALNRPLPATCGQIPLFPADKLTTAQHAVRAFKHLVVALLVVTPLLALLTLWLTRRRRRTLLQMGVGVVLATVVLRRVVFWLQDTLVSAGKPENEAARSAIVHQVLHGFFVMTVWMLWIAFAVVVLAVVTGPYRWAVTSRHWIARTGRDVAGSVRVAAGRAKDGTGAGWLPAHLDLLRIGGVVVAVAVVLLFDLNVVGMIIVLALLAVYEFWLYRVGRQTAPPHAAPG